jgi:hypothetical protein
MSIESTLERIAISAERSELLLAKLVDILDNRELPDLLSDQPPAPVPAPVPTPAPAPEPVPMPAAFMPPPAPAAAPTVPFTDQAGLIKYCMERYRTLGPAKGGMIQGIINELGFNNVADITAPNWPAFYAKCEAL